MSGNPLLGDRLFKDVDVGTSGMTIKGTVNRLAMLLAMTTITAAWSWQRFLADPGQGMLFALGGAITALLLCLVLAFKRDLAGWLAPAYALAEGVFLGAISARYNALYGGIVFQALFLTFAVTGAMLLSYATGLIRATPGLTRFVVVATMGLALFYVVAAIMSLFGLPVQMITSSSPLGIGFSLFVVGLAAFNLIIDFAEIENAAKQGMPKYMEWYGAFAMLVTLVWLYVELLRLLSKLRDE